MICAGITLFSPLKDHGFIGAKVAVVGIGGLGHLAIKYAVQLGMQVSVFSTSEIKRADALAYGAKEFFICNEENLKQNNFKFDLILNCSTVYKIQEWMPLLAPHGKFIVIGIPDVALQQPLNAFDIIPYSR